MSNGLVPEHGPLVVGNAALANELLRRFAEQTPKARDAVYHYTTQAGLLGIVEKHEIWASDVRFLNDSREFVHTLDLAKVALQQWPSPVEASLEPLRRSFEAILSLLSKARVYAVSFAEGDDDLSQWRGYGRGGGYALRFSSPHLATVLAEVKGLTAWLPCVYNELDQATYICEGRDYVVARFRDDTTPNPEQDFYYGTNFLVYLLMLAACFKSDRFAHEQEWRLVLVELPGGTALPRRYRTGPYSLVPYVTFNLRTAQTSCPIEEVIVGPTPYLDIATAPVADLLQQHGYTSPKVRPSKVPFREPRG